MPLPPISASSTYQILVPSDSVKDQRSRLTMYAAWIDSLGGQWYAPDLAAYRDHLLHVRGLSAATVAAHISTVRSQYRALLRSNDLRDRLYTSAPARASATRKKAFVDELLTRMQNAADPAAAPVKLVTKQDRTDSEHIRLTVAQANALIAAPNVETLIGLRDAAIITLMLCTGVRETELCALNVGDLRQRCGGTLALHVRKGKGSKERLIPYGALDGCLAYVDAWLKRAGITDGAAFRGVRRGSRVSVYNSRLTVRTVQNVLHKYPIVIDGEPVLIDPHDLRRTYARRLYDCGFELMALQQNLGHASLKTTQGYIGALDALDAVKRLPPPVYTFSNIRQLD